MLTLVLGGARSGKSHVAERLAAASPPPVTYVATATADPTDEDFSQRIAAHRARRPADWTTEESGADLAGTIAGLPPHGTLLIDSLGTWVAATEGLAVDVPGLLSALAGFDRHTVVVSEEVGLGVHPAAEAGRRFRDVLGEVNRAVADIADEVLLVVAGRVLPLDPMPVDRQ